MKLSKSKLALAKVINENGGWVDDSVYAANDECGIICGYLSKPIRRKTTSYHWIGSQRETWIRGIKTPQWHQCVLSREEYYHAYPKADADGWIEWSGGECPVDGESIVDVEFNSGNIFSGVAKGLSWRHEWKYSNVIAYRLHKPEVKPEFCESVMRSIPEPKPFKCSYDPRLISLANVRIVDESIDDLCAKVTEENKHHHIDTKPTIEQLAQDYRNKLDLSNRKQQEADNAKASADAALGELERAGEAIGLLIGIAKPDREPELVITDWRDLRVNDVIFVDEYDGHESGEHVVVSLEDDDYDGDYAVMATGIDGCDRWVDTTVEWRLIRRP